MNKIKQILPNKSYFDNEWFEKEQKIIFEKEWQFVGFLETFNEDKYYFKTIGTSNIVLFNHNSRLKAFYNMCRHRGIQLLHKESKKENTIRCPYHNWVYELDGSLKGLPQSKEFEGLDKSCMGLLEVKVEIWEGMVFVNLDKNAGTLKSTLDPIKDKIFPYESMDFLESNDGYRYIINANWKIFIENYMDIYHLFHIHKDSLKEYKHKDSMSEFINNHWVFFEPLSEEGKKTSSWWDSYLNRIDSYTGENGAYVSMLFPNFGITATEYMCLFIDIQPISSEETEIIVYVKSKSGSKKTKTLLVYDYKNNDNPIEKLLDKPDVMNEDIYACEMIQNNIKSSSFEVSILAQNLEKPLFEYQSIIKSKMVK